MNSFSNLDITHLKEYLILLDIDGTLANDDELKLSEKTIKKVKDLKKSNQVYLCSNSVNHKRNNKVAELTDTEYLETDIKKPSKKILNLISHSEYEKKLVIGDKLLTDGLFAKNIKADFIKVSRIGSKNDKIYIRLLYWIDDLIAKLIGY